LGIAAGAEPFIGETDKISHFSRGVHKLNLFIRLDELDGVAALPTDETFEDLLIATNLQ
jgi:hypothetical protein